MSDLADDLRPPKVRAGKGLALAVTGALLASGLGGLAFGRAIETRKAAAPSGGIASMGTEVGTETEAGVEVFGLPLAGVEPAEEEEVPAPVLARRVQAPRLRLLPARLSAPPNPFQPPVSLEPTVLVNDAPALQEEQAADGTMTAPPARPGTAVPKAPAKGRSKPAAPQAAPAPDAPRPEEFAVVGLIQGDPPLAVVEYAGQQFYLKAGDRVADTWRLEEIKERSATFRLGDQRVEVPINGGRSQ